MKDVLFGPRFDRLGSHTIVLNVLAHRHSAVDVRGPLSIKHVVEGEATWQVGQQRFTVDSESALILSRDERYSLQIDSSTPVRTHVVFFSHALESEAVGARKRSLPELLDDPFDADPDAMIGVSRRLWNAGRFKTQLYRLAALVEDAERTPGEEEDPLRTLLDLMLDLHSEVRSEIARIAAARPSTKQELHRRMLLGKAIFDETYADPFSLQCVAAASCVAPHHFHRTFKAVFGMTPYAYVADRRMRKARALIASGKMNVTEACMRVGYNSVATFSRQFSEKFGHAPVASKQTSPE